MTTIDNTKRDAVIAKIRALLAKTTEAGATEAEAMAAAEKAGQLLEQYRITMTDIEVRAEPVLQEQVKSPNSARRAPADRVLWAISKYAGVKVWSHSGRYTHRAVTFFGLEADVKFAIYLYEMVNHAADSALRGFQKTSIYQDSYDRRRATASFLTGMTGRISNRLSDMTRERDQTPMRTASGTALVLLKNAIVEQAFDNLNLKLGTARVSASAIYDGGAYTAGAAAGDRVRFDRPLSGGSQRALR